MFIYIYMFYYMYIDHLHFIAIYTSISIIASIIRMSTYFHIHDFMTLQGHVPGASIVMKQFAVEMRWMYFSRDAGGLNNLLLGKNEAAPNLCDLSAKEHQNKENVTTNHLSKQPTGSESCSRLWMVSKLVTPLNNLPFW